MENNIITANIIEKACNGKLLTKGNDEELLNFNIDTRKLNIGDMFVAIKGEEVDGHDFIMQALKSGAIGCIVERDISTEILNKYENKNIIKVENSIIALQQLATYKRSLYNIPVIAITGSVGKTSTKDIIANILEQKYRVLKTEGNFNNHIGLPLTLLKLKEQEAVVVEMGMNHFGEISVLTKIAKPTIVVLTNIGTSHIGILKSQENILKAKLEILEGLDDGGTVIINNDDKLLSNWAKEEKKYNIYTYGINNKSTYNATNIKQNDEYTEFEVNENKIKMPIQGKHFVLNSLAAIAVGNALNISMDKIKSGIESIEITDRRMKEYILNNNITIIDDTYNASYESIRAALQTLTNYSGRKIAVLGDVLELGEYSQEIHEKIGEEVAKNSIDILITAGREAKFIAKKAKELGIKLVYEFDNIEEATIKIQEAMSKNDIILIKASNGMRFNKIVEKIIK